MRFGHHIGSLSARRRTAVPIGSGQSTGSTPNPTPPPDGVFGGGAGAFFEDFKAGYVLGEGEGHSTTNTTDDGSKRVGHLWGDGWRATHYPDCG